MDAKKSEAKVSVSLKSKKRGCPELASPFISQLPKDSVFLQQEAGKETAQFVVGIQWQNRINGESMGLDSIDRLLKIMNKRGVGFNFNH